MLGGQMNILVGRVIRGGGFAALMAFSTSASAATIYDEGVSGDLDAVGTTVVDLAAGSNTIMGVIRETPAGDSDRIRFRQIAGLIVDSIQLTFTGLWDTANIGQSLNSALFNNQANLFDDSFGGVTGGGPGNPPTISASFFDSFGPETGPLSKDVDGAIWDFSLSSGVVFPAANWVLTITTSQKPLPPPTPEVPLPAGLPLLLAGLGTFAFLQRRKG